ncbi:MotA/TolQ/ExbB proton channel family protein [Coraliomargarita sp. SDUM461003]|uniref:MotA/TolQ/ExbB proton channel family protein n=1 Tax=Thalassobacterium maritimum TaxID=3041265 RepID=A0ABU1AT08_9BACT|nr:MotA/TolQ/ExbB proton channel family protein [Coraliomargarita sp. SDUM461003]MDQ8207289.1 MotA/TolQ/ExbB proton channel family protein [Coraliomargarita sp. SDUM461003]
MKNKLCLFVLCASSLLFTGLLANLHAQDSSTDDMAELTPPPAEKTLLDMVKAGGWAMFPLGVLSVATVGFAVFNFIAIRRSSFIDDSVIEELDAAVSQMDIDKAHQICTDNPSPVTNTFNFGLDQVRHKNFSTDAVEKAFDNASTKELSGAFIIVSYLSIIAAIAPMVGLLGTVSGMVKAFNSIASQGMGKPELLADNISEALITTATGMAIAIPAMFFFFFFRNRYGKIVAEVNLTLGRLYSDLLRAAGK